MAEKKKVKCPVCGKKLMHVRRHMRSAHPDEYYKTRGQKVSTYEQKNVKNESYLKIEEVRFMAKREPKKEEDMDECGGCHEKVPQGAKYCPGCGCEFE